MSATAKPGSANVVSQRELAEQMLEFARQIPASADLEWVKDYDFLFYFEAERLIAMRQALLESGFTKDQSFEVLDVGYLHGLVPEFLHRFFPAAKFTVLDHPQSPNFANAAYLELIRSRDYMKLEAWDISRIDAYDRKFDLIILGEIIEHLDPTVLAVAAAGLRKKIHEHGTLLITTPNGAGIHNSVYTFFGRDAQHPPIPDRTMNYGHIHLWTPNLLQRTLEHFGWRHVVTLFSHGFDRTNLANANRNWGSLTYQVMTRLLYLAADVKPKWRAFMVCAWKPGDTPR